MSQYGGDAGYAFEKFQEAVAILATDPGGIRSRLMKAVPAILALEEATIPPVLSTSYASLVSDLTRLKPRNNEGTIRATLGRVRLVSCEALAVRIVNSQSICAVWLLRSARRGALTETERDHHGIACG